VIVWDAAERAEVEKVAVPPAVSGPVPIEAAPSLNVTVPVGVPEPGLFTVTVAVNVTPCPNTDGFGADSKAVVVWAWFTV
jgi:hypothetical protein